MLHEFSSARDVTSHNGHNNYVGSIGDHHVPTITPLMTKGPCDPVYSLCIYLLGNNIIR